MDIGKSFTYIRDDKKWRSKIILPGLLFIVPVLNLIWIGYTTSLMQNISQKYSYPLPEWRDAGQFLKTGFSISLAAFIYSLPGILLGFIPLVFLFNSNLNQGKEIEEALLAIIGGGGIIALGCLSLYIVIFCFIFPSIHLNYARHGTLKSCFQLKESIQQISLNSADYIVAWLITLLVFLFLGSIAIIVSGFLVFIPCLGWMITFCMLTFTGVYISTIYAHLFGQIGNELSFTEQLLLER